ncbi:hypothetical protein PT015_23230 [Candidatus Mycobacterium wuenschmannii]|uniref:Uncharacterized protein n=1 Tax=Candidatus Mycobacterium wuenschmannii TaxID=3027808 RepID=A0ABY8VW24_9MYCO|nr:hypothetical protein [Candidatus Mycobacterium wuenschmannii]WIM87707.1 hypothetical protein PT015_23230 [Candidatus Mycobacterium wuenschmannii]
MTAREPWPEEYVPEPPPPRAQPQGGDRPPWKKSTESVDSIEYTDEERLINARVQGARRWHR